MKKLLVASLGALFMVSASAGVVKSLALDRMKDLDSVMALDKKALALLKTPDANPTLIQRDQNRRYLDLIKKSSSTFTEGRSADGGDCLSAMNFAHETWQAKVQYQQTKSNFDKETVTNMTKLYREWRTECNAFLKTLK